MGAVLSVELPLASAHHQLRQTSSLIALPTGSSPPILASLPSEPSTKLPSSLKLFSSLLPKLWSLWEVLVLCEPVLVFAKNPRDASLAVWWLIELLRPVRCIGNSSPGYDINSRDYFIASVSYGLPAILSHPRCGFRPTTGSECGSRSAGQVCFVSSWGRTESEYPWCPPWLDESVLRNNM